MSRIKLITEREDLHSEDHHIFNQIVGTRGRISGPFSVLLHSPEIAGRSAHLGSYIRFESVLSDEVREPAIITAAREMNCAYEWAYHVGIAEESGVPEEVIRIINERSPVTNLDATYSSVIAFSRELLVDKRVTADTFARAGKLLGDRGVTELTATIGYFGMLACALNACEVQPEPGKPTLLR